MNNINDILHKTYQRIVSTSGDTFYASQLDGEFVIFSNGARIKLTTLLADFETVGAINETASNKSQNTESQILNPDTFFSSTAPLPEVKTVEQAIAPTIAPSTIDGKPAFNNSNELGGLKLNDDTPTNSIAIPQQQQQPQPSNRLPEWDSFDRVKKSEDVELNVTIKIKLPKARHIESINDMYETSFVAYLAKQYMADPMNIQKQIREAIEEWVEIEMNGGKPVRKKSTKKVRVHTGSGNKKIKGVPRVALKITDALDLVEPKAMPIEAGSAASMFGQEQIVKDVTKLFVISEEEQYIAAKEYLSKLEPSHPDYYRFEDMINIWEENQITK